MRELTPSELSASSGGVLTAGVAILVAGATLYGAARSIYAFGKAVGVYMASDPADDTKQEA